MEPKKEISSRRKEQNISQEIKQRAEHAKAYIERHYSKKLEESKERKTQVKELQEKMEQLGLS